MLLISAFIHTNISAGTGNPHYFSYSLVSQFFFFFLLNFKILDNLLFLYCNYGCHIKKEHCTMQIICVQTRTPTINNYCVITI